MGTNTEICLEKKKNQHKQKAMGTEKKEKKQEKNAKKKKKEKHLNNVFKYEAFPENESDLVEQNGNNNDIVKRKNKKIENEKHKNDKCQKGKSKMNKKEKDIKKSKGKKNETDYVYTECSEMYNGSEQSTQPSTEYNPYTNEEIEASDDEYQLNTLGDFDLKHYENFDITGYDIHGQKIYKPKENLIDEFIQFKTDKNAWRKIKDPKNNRVIELTDTDLEIIKRIRENKVATFMDPSDYTYENEKEEYKLYPVMKWNSKKTNDQIPKHEAQKIRNIMRHLLQKQKYPEKFEPKTNIYDLWGNNIFGAENSSPEELLLPFVLPGHKDSYNPPEEYKYDEERKNKILKKKPDALIPSVYGDITKLKCSPKIFYDVYQRCLDLLYRPRSIKPKMDIKKEDLLPKIPPVHSLKPFPEYPFIKYNMHEENEKEDKNGTHSNVQKAIGINERENILFVIQHNKLYIFDIMTSYNVACISLESYFDQLMQIDPQEKKQKPQDSTKKHNIEKHQNNVMIKVNKSYSIVAISFADHVLLFHYQQYAPPPRPRVQRVEEIQCSLKKRKGNDAKSQSAETTEESTRELKTDSEDDSDREFDEYANVDDDEEMSEEEGEEEEEEEEDEKKGNKEEKKGNKEEKKSNNKLKSKKPFSSSYNNYQIFSKTRNLINMWKEHFKKSKTICYSDKLGVTWIQLNSTDVKIKHCVAIKHPGKIRDISWSDNGNYLSVTCMREMGPYHDVFLHHVKSIKTIKLIKKYKQKRGDIIQTMFFTNSPYFAVAFKRSVIIYNLKSRSSKKRIYKTLTGVDGITSFDIHKNEEYVIVSNNTGTAFIFDLELSSTPYKKFHLQNVALTKVLFSKSHHLFCSLSEQGIINLFYSKFFDDYITDPILIPIIQLKNESKIVDIVWSERMPWLFAQTEKNTALLYT